MIHLAADENFARDIIAGVRRRDPNIEILRAQDAGLTGADDATILGWAARNGYVLLTHDKRTLIGLAYERIQSGLPMPGVFAIRQDVPVGDAIEDIVLLAECSLEGEWEGQVRYLPFRR